MTSNLLDFSRRADLRPFAVVVQAIETAAAPLRLKPMIVGAFARDLHLVYRYGIDCSRQTEDLDLGVAVPDWPTFEALKSSLVKSGAFSVARGVVHRLRHRDGLPVDLVPFGAVETRARTIEWPLNGDQVMDAFGYREALANACELSLPENVNTQVVSLPGLALLKVVCWKERHYLAPRKDAQDLLLITRNYLQAGNEARLWDEFASWLKNDRFDYEFAGARMLGHDMRGLVDDDGVKRIGAILSEQSAAENPGRLPIEMDSEDPGRAARLLDAILKGFKET